MPPYPPRIGPETCNDKKSYTPPEGLLSMIFTSLRPSSGWASCPGGAWPLPDSSPSGSLCASLPGGPFCSPSKVLKVSNQIDHDLQDFYGPVHSILYNVYTWNKSVKTS